MKVIAYTLSTWQYVTSFRREITPATNSLIIIRVSVLSCEQMYLITQLIKPILLYECLEESLTLKCPQLVKAYKHSQR